MQRRPRVVEVNVNPRGMVHELTCRWLLGALDSGGLNPASYTTMPANQVPSGTKNCWRC